VVWHLQVLMLEARLSVWKLVSKLETGSSMLERYPAQRLKLEKSVTDS